MFLGLVKVGAAICKSSIRESRAWVPGRHPPRGISDRPAPSLAARREGAGSSEHAGRGSGFGRDQDTGAETRSLRRAWSDTSSGKILPPE